MNPLSGARLAEGTDVAEIIASFAAQGWHRTGSSTDRRSARWLSEQVAGLGRRARSIPFAFSRYVPRQAFVEVAGRRWAGLSCFDAPDTAPSGSCGRLVTVDAGGCGGVGLVVSGPGATKLDDLAQLRRSGRYEALVVVTVGARPGLAPHNAEFAEAPFGCPVVQVGSGAQAPLERAAQEQRRVRVHSVGRHETVNAHNVAVRLESAGASAPVVVLTPRSGWWGCAAERGGGLVCWLEVVRTITVKADSRPVTCLATSGHELGYLGLRRAFDADPVLSGFGVLWLHLGANLGARGGSVHLAASDAELGCLGTAALEAASCRIVGPPSIGGALGEGSELARRGARFISMVGTNDWFHLRSDRWPDSVDDAEVGRLARAAATLTQEMRGLGAREQV